MAWLERGDGRWRPLAAALENYPLEDGMDGGNRCNQHTGGKIEDSNLGGITHDRNDPEKRHAGPSWRFDDRRSIFTL